MKTLSDFCGLPLLARDLGTRAQKRGTYVWRFLFALGLSVYALLFGLLWQYTQYISSSSPFWYLGSGRNILNRTIEALLIGVYLLLPALLSGAIASEREQQSMPLMLITRMGGWRILWEKYLAGLIGACGILVLSIPLLAVAYPLGGITQADVVNGIWGVMLTTIQVGAISLCCSCWFQTATAAYLATYGVLFALSFGLMFVFELMQQFVAGQLLGTLLEYCIEGLFPAVRFAIFIPFWSYVNPGPSRAVEGTLFLFLAYNSLVVFVEAGVALLVARWVLIPRSLDPQLGIIGWWRRRQHARREILESTVTSRSPRRRIPLPDVDPIAWRESRRSWWFLAAWILVTGCMLCYKLWHLIRGNFRETGIFIGWMEIAVGDLWLISVTTAVIQREQARQTWQVLLVTPLATRELLRQKMRRVWTTWGWIVGYLAVPLIGSLLMWDSDTWRALPQALIRYQQNGATQTAVMHPIVDLIQLIVSLLMGLVYLPLAVWIALGFSLYMKTQVRALVATVIWIMAWVILPIMGLTLCLILISAWYPSFMSGERFWEYLIMGLYLFSPPAVSVVVGEVFLNKSFAALMYLILNFTCYGILLYAIRGWVLRAAIRKLGRLEPERVQTSSAVSDQTSSHPLVVGGDS